MSDNLMAYYDESRDAVVVQLESGSEIAVFDRDEAASFADEVAAAAKGESTGYEEYLAQQDFPDQSTYGNDEPDQQPTAAAEDAIRMENTPEFLDEAGA